MNPVDFMPVTERDRDVEVTVTLVVKESDLFTQYRSSNLASWLRNQLKDPDAIDWGGVYQRFEKRLGPAAK